MLVQTYGGVPLDLGAGELKFNTSPVRTSVRNTVPEVYTKAIFPDLLTCHKRFAGCWTFNRYCNQNGSPPVFVKSLPDLCMVAGKPKQYSYLSGSCTGPTLTGMMPHIIFSRLMTWQLPPLIIRGLSALQPTFYDVNVGGNERNK